MRKNEPNLPGMDCKIVCTTICNPGRELILKHYKKGYQFTSGKEYSEGKSVDLRITLAMPNSSLYITKSVFINHTREIVQSAIVTTLNFGGRKSRRISSGQSKYYHEIVGNY